MNRPRKPGPNATLREALAYVAQHPRHWPGFARVVVRHFYARGRLCVMCWCWSRGYRVATVRRLAREAGR